MDVDDFGLYPPDVRLLDGRIAMVTGATSGIGRGTAFELAAHGAAVAINHRDADDAANEMAAAIEARGGRAVPVGMNVAKEKDVIRAFDEVEASLGRVDLLVNNAGVEAPHKLVDLELDEWERVVRVNLTGAFLCSRQAARGLLGAGARGVIVFISSVHEVIPWVRFSHYAASKGGMKLFAQSIARELAPHGIRVVSVAPGAIETPINEDVLKDPEQRRAVLDQIPYGRWGNVDDVSRAVAWVASPQADYVVGATLFVDGGMTLYPEFD